MVDFLTPYASLYYHRIDVRIVAMQDTTFDAWPGAVIRNNLLFASGQILITEGISLREKINKIPLSGSHPLYRDLSGGFPPGYRIILQSHKDMPEVLPLRKSDILSFSIILIGDIAQHFKYFIQAIRLMCQRGFGHPMTPFLLVDICENSLSGGSQLLATEQSDLSDQLQFPVRLNDFCSGKIIRGGKTLKISLETPVNLYKQAPKKDVRIDVWDGEI